MMHPLLAEALRRKGYDTLTAVQAAVADPKLWDRDLLVSSKTGSGKTVAYGLGMATALLPDALPDALAEAGGGHPALPPASKPLGLVIAPTRELALQVQRELRWLYEATGAIITACVGGMDQRAERRHLERGVHIVVGTPGRLVDHLTRGALQLDQLAVAVLDEADEMLDLGFREDLELILAATPPARRTLLFSATLPKGIVALATRFQRNAARIEVAADVSGHADIEHQAALVRPNAIEKGVVNLLRQTESPAALVFCNTRDAVRRMHATLIERGFSAVILSGELGQHERNQALQALRDGRARVCIATDVAARGIDLPHLGLVIHADLPHDAEVLQHRSGRTGRAGRKGVSVMLVPPSRRGKANRLYAEGGISPRWVALPSADDIRALDRTRVLADEAPFADLSDDDREMAAALLASRPAEEIAAALARVFRARLPEPEEIDPLPLEDMRPAGPKRADRASDGAAAFRWFELNVGRRDGAEPKNLLRMLSRSGGVERRHVGGIRIQDRTCHVEIAVEVADRFQKRTANAAPDDIQVRPIDEPPPRPKRDGGSRAPRKEGSKPAYREGHATSKHRHAPGAQSERKGKGKRNGKG
jgi:ATP-dependent RNA helicase DeaD